MNLIVKAKTSISKDNLNLRSHLLTFRLTQIYDRSIKCNCNMKG